MATAPGQGDLLVGLGNPYQSAFAVTPSDSVNFTVTTRGVYVGGTGDVTAVLLSGDVVTFKAVPVGTTLLIRCTRINATSTTATLLLGLA